MGLVSFRNQQADRRAHERRRVRFGSFIALPDASLWVKCQTLDLSFSGTRVQLDEMPNLPEALYFLQMRDRLAYEAQVVWRKPPQMGLQFFKVYRFDEVPGMPMRQLIEKVSG